MNREDELIREALQLDVCPSEELNRKILQSAEEKRRPNRSALRTLATVAAIIIVLLGTATVVNAATGGKVTEYLKEKISKLTYIFGYGSNVTKELVQEPDGEWSEKVTFADDGVSFKVRISTNVVSYDLFLKIACEHYGVKYDSFTHLTTFLQEGDPEEALYYDIRGGFHKNLRDYQRDEEKAQVLTALREAAAHADRDAVKNGLLDLAADLEQNRRIFYNSIPWGLRGSDGWDIFFVDITELPLGEAAIIVESVSGKKCWVYRGIVEETGMNYTSSWFYTEESVRALRNDGVTVYDLRKTK